MRRFAIPMFILISILFTSLAVHASDFSFLEGAVIVAQDKQFLGVISTNRHNSNSISNRYGSYGSSYSSTSIFNQYNRYSSRYSNLSAFNPNATKPPMVFMGTEFLGYLTVNIKFSRKIDPYALIGWIEQNRR